MLLSRFFIALWRLFVDALGVFVTLLKVMVPALLVVKVLEMVGATQWVGVALGPLMELLGLPPELGIVWAATLLTNIFTGLVVFFEVTGDASLSVTQVTVLGALLLIGHSLPVEGAVAKRAGVPWWATIVLRVGGALVFAALVNWSYRLLGARWLGYGQQAAELAWRPEPPADGVGHWLVGQLSTLGLIFVIIFALMALLEVLRFFNLERLVHLALSPLLRLLGIGRGAANVTVIGVTLGLSYGAGLLIRDLNAGVMSRRDAILALCFLGLCHSVIEDTLLILLLGAELWAVLGVRIVFSIVVIALIARWPQQQRPASRRRPEVNNPPL
ncbi:hypothetical protein [Halomonas halocynthiae]|uniref:hypothetical protein n=1 Tax=Halomonas halocynthiae TaxID=176290 RepID=UPI00040CDC71|nr:hypothetical protein [Halomonas halocynthiae]